MLKPMITALVLIATPLMAETDGICPTLGDLAEAIMENRQLGTPMSLLIETINATGLTRSMIIVAYDTPRFATEDYQKRAVEDFRNEIEVMCYQSD